MVQLPLHKCSFIAKEYLGTTAWPYVQWFLFTCLVRKSKQRHKQWLNTQKLMQTPRDHFPPQQDFHVTTYLQMHEGSQNKSRICCLSSSFCSLAGEKGEDQSLTMYSCKNSFTCSPNVFASQLAVMAHENAVPDTHVHLSFITWCYQEHACPLDLLNICGLGHVAQEVQSSRSSGSGPSHRFPLATHPCGGP